MSVVVRNAKDRIQSVVVRTHMFSTWPATMVDKLLEGAELRRFADGEQALRSGQLSPHIVIVASGCFVNERPVPKGEAMITDFMMPGQATSFLAVFDGLPATYDITAVGESDMVFVPRKSVLDALAFDPKRWEDVVLMLCRRQRIEYENVYMRTANSLRCQLAKIILYWARSHWSEGNKGARIPLPISQENIAAMLGKSRPTINKEIGALIAKGILARSYRRVEVIDMAGLRAIVDTEDPGSLQATEALFIKPLKVYSGSD